MRVPRILFWLGWLAIGILAVLLTLKVLFERFTSIHPLPAWANHHPALILALRYWPIPVAFVTGIAGTIAITIGVIRVCRNYVRWDSSYEVPHWHPDRS